MTPLRRFSVAALSLFVCLSCVLNGESAPAARPSREDQALLQGLKQAAEKDLSGNILPFWLKNSPNAANGGFFNEMDWKLVLKPKAPRGSLLTSRILWTYSAAHRLQNNPGHLAMAQRAAADLRDHFIDPVHGGVYWSIKADGKPLDTTKHTYTEAFAVYAFSEYYRATGEEWARDKALEIYRLLETHSRDRVHGGYREAFTRDWKLIGPGRGNLIGARSEKSQNTNLHVMEALANLYRASPTAEVAESLRAEIVVMMDKVIDARTHHLNLFQHDDWTPYDDTVSYGHDIEFAWLLTEAVDVLGDETLKPRAREISVAVARVTLAQGVDKDGGIFGEGTPEKVINPMKEWWPQAEAVVGFLNAYQISGDRTYLEAARKTWEFIDRRVIDHEKGEWFRVVNQDPGKPNKQAKISFWKCPYHNGRACMEIAARVDELLKSEPSR